MDNVRNLYKQMLELDCQKKKLEIKKLQLEIEKLEHEKMVLVHLIIPLTYVCSIPLTFHVFLFSGKGDYE